MHPVRPVVLLLEIRVGEVYEGGAGEDPGGGALVQGRGLLQEHLGGVNVLKGKDDLKHIVKVKVFVFLKNQF